MKNKVHILFLLADITQSQKFADDALKLLVNVQECMDTIKNDMSFSHGITGCCWLIEYLVHENFLQEDPQELLEEIDAHIIRYLEIDADSLTVTELAGIGKYYLARFHNRPSLDNKKALINIESSLKAKLSFSQSFHDIRTYLDALDILNECGTDVSELAHLLERLVNQTNLSQVKQEYCFFRLYTITRDEYLLVCIREGLKNLVPQLMNLPDALMLAEMLYYTNNNHNHKTS